MRVDPYICACSQAIVTLNLICFFTATFNLLLIHYKKRKPTTLLISLNNIIIRQ